MQKHGRRYADVLLPFGFYAEKNCVRISNFFPDSCPTRCWARLRYLPLWINAVFLFLFSRAFLSRLFLPIFEGEILRRKKGRSVPKKLRSGAQAERSNFNLLITLQNQWMRANKVTFFFQVGEREKRGTVMFSLCQYLECRGNRRRGE